MNRPGLLPPPFSTSQELEQTLKIVLQGNLFTKGIKTKELTTPFSIQRIKLGPADDTTRTHWLRADLSLQDNLYAQVPLLQLPHFTSRGTFWLRGPQDWLERLVPLQLPPARGLPSALRVSLGAACRRATLYFTRNPLADLTDIEALLLPCLRQILTVQLERNLRARSQSLDCTNPVAELAHLRKVSFRVRGPIASQEISERHVDDRWRNMLCPVETPESVRIGLQVHLAVGATLAEGHLQAGPTPTLIGSSAALIPFLEHNDPNRAMMGAKYLKQALPLLDPQVALVQTGFESEVIEAQELVIRARQNGRILQAGARQLRVEYADGSQQSWDLLHPGPQPGTGRWFRLSPDLALVAMQGTTVQAADSDLVVLSRGDMVRAPTDWERVAQVGQSVPAGDPLFLKREFQQGQILAAHACTRHGQLALGRNALTAFMPWYGYNFEDALVISQDLADALGHWHIEAQGVSPVALEVGDKLAGRHGNKGVVAKILPRQAMPRLADGTPIQILINPHSVLSRMNLGQLYETQWGWLAQQRDCPQLAPAFQGGGWPRLAEALGESDGKQEVFWSDPSSQEPCQTRVVVGFHYLLKLNHCARSRLAVRAQGPRGSITAQPLRGARRGGGQRVGEMESWALLAHQAHHNLQEVLSPKSDQTPTESFRVFCQYLQALGYRVNLNDQSLSLGFEDGAALDLPLAQQVALIEETIQCACGHQAYAGEWKSAGARAGPRRCPRCGGDQVERRAAWHRDGLMGKHLFGELEDKERFQAAQIRLVQAVPHPLDERQTLAALYVLPPALRPYQAHHPGLTEAYRQVMLANRPGSSHSRTLARRIGELWQALGECLKGKTGLMRGSLLGRRVDYSARAVIVPDPGLSFGHCRLPRAIITAWPAGPVLLNRAPSLHRYNIQSFEVAGDSAGPVIALHPMACGGFAADFDGDTMAVHAPCSEAARHEAGQRLSASAQLFSVAHGGCMLHLEQDLVSGAHLLGQAPTKEQLQAWITHKLRAGMTGPEIDQWMRQAFRAATLHGLSISVGDLVGLSSDPPLEELARQGHPIGVMVFSRARGNPEVLRRLQQGLIQGLSPDSYWEDCKRARQEMLPKKLGTPKGGELTRKLVYGLYPITLAQGECAQAEPRSPLGCDWIDRDQICQACYGPDLSTAQAGSPGLPIGILAAQSIGERATQDFMKVFHGTQGASVSHIEQARAFFDTAKVPDGLPADSASLVEWLYDSVYECKVARVHFQLVLAAMGEGATRRGLNHLARHRPSWLARAAFRGLLTTLKAAARDGQLEDFSCKVAQIVKGTLHEP